MPDIQFTFEVNDMVSGALDGISATFEKAFEQDKTLAKFNAGLGQSAQVTEEMGKLAKEVWSDGWGGSLEDVTGALGEVGSQMMDLGASSPDEIKKVTKGALDLAEVMGVDVTEVTRAAGQMMKNGLAPDAQTAFDIIATGAQNGGNRSGDLLDVFAEYGPAFAAIGVDGQTALGMLNSSLDDGAFNADKAADAINEFGVRAIDGSKATSEAYAALGLDAADLSAKIASGGPAAQEATSKIIYALGEMTDPVAQEAAGVAFFGSMWEDMGPKAILALDPVYSKTGEVGGAVETMGGKLHDVATNKVETMKRKFDEWIGSMVATRGPFGEVMAFAVGFAPQALTVAGNVGMVAMALKGTGVAAWAATAGMSALSVAALPIYAIAAAVTGLIGMVVVAIQKIDTLKRNWEGITTGNLTKASDIGLSLNRPGLSNGLFGGIFGHAAGGLVTRPHLAMVGEGGEPELITPLSKVGDMLAAQGGGGGGDVYVTVPNGFIGSKDELAAALRDLLAYGGRTGIIPAST
jgi:hypothetical protein